ncbi:MAG: PAS-domain containing protein [Gammaproteobacteria bacterium]|nr:PAS-domain containing protein [Gammaproteobacteria bacterium]
MNALTLFFVVLSYIAVLFMIARLGDKGHFARIPAFLIYSFSIAIYCTSWTFYGAVGSAVSNGWMFLPIYLGPALLFLFGHKLLYKLLIVCKEQNLSSIADFIALRYGKRAFLSVAVTLLLMIAIIPYIALQLKAIAFSFDGLTRNVSVQATDIDTALFTAIAMALLAIFFGTQSAEATKPRSGLMYTIAFESVIKLLVLVALAIFCLYWLSQDTFGTAAGTTEFFSSQFSFDQLNFSFFTQLLLSACAMICLPRQFHITFIENTDPHHLAKARWIFPLYLLVITLVVFPITAMGTELFGVDSRVAPDTYVLAIPFAQNEQVLSGLMFIGGFAASTGMIIISTLALSTMITNSIILPYFVKRLENTSENYYRPLVIKWRRAAIAVILLMAYLYKVVIGDYFALAATGLIAFSLVAQLIPSILAGLYWKDCSYRGVRAGLIIGSLIWFYFIMLPSLAAADLFGQPLVSNGPFAIAWLAPSQFLGLDFDAFNIGVWLSLSANSFVMIFVSKQRQVNFSEATQATAFTHPLKLSKLNAANKASSNVTGKDIIQLLARFLGEHETGSLIHDFETNFGLIELNKPPSAELLEFAEKRLAGAIGTTTASTVIASIIGGRSLTPESLVNLFDETSQQIKFNQKLLHATLENISQGISVVDKHLKLVAWNQRYIELFNYPSGFIKPGMAIAEVVRFNANQGVMGDGSLEQHVRKRLDHLRRGTAYVFQREWPDGRVLEMRGNPMPGGGFVTSYTDITEYKDVERQLKESRDQLELRVAQRTEQIQQINEELTQEIELRKASETLMNQAKLEAENANKTKTQFIALASHDILQPLTAARLYASALDETEMDNEVRTVVNKINLSLKSTENLVATLLEIARFDQGALTPTKEPFPIADIMDSLVNEFSVLAAEKNFSIRMPRCSRWVYSDKQWLRRLLQNFLSNAIKYSTGPKILFGCRRLGNNLRIQVSDCGPGIPSHEQKAIFSDFYRSPNNKTSESGAGLGLSVVARMSESLEHPIGIVSAENSYSTFYVDVPLSQPSTIREPTIDRQTDLPHSDQTVWYIDNDLRQLDAMKTLLKKWGIPLHCEHQIEAAIEQSAQQRPDILIMDFDLNATVDGVQLYELMKQHWPVAPKAYLLTANQEPSIREQAKSAGMEYIKKPAKPAALRAILNR